MVDGMIYINTSLFAALSVLHVYWAFGGKWRSKSSIPTKRGTNHPLFEARIVGTLIIGVGLLLFAAVSMANMLMADSKTINVLTYCIAIIFFIRTVGDFKYVGVFKKVKGTGFANADTKFYVPLCAYISISSFYIAAF